MHWQKMVNMCLQENGLPVCCVKNYLKTCQNLVKSPQPPKALLFCCWQRDVININYQIKTNTVF